MSCSRCRPQIGDIAYQNKAVIYDLLFKVSAETMLTIAADPKHLGARIGITSVLHTWGSAMTHHPHVHMIVPGGGISLDGSGWVAKGPMRGDNQGERAASIRMRLRRGWADGGRAIARPTADQPPAARFSEPVWRL